MVLLTLAAATLAVKTMSNNSENSQIARDKITAAALAQAKDALIGYAVQDMNRPGKMPCPDSNNNGTVDIFSGDDCPSYIGRLPWKTLDLPDLHDGNGERLWYAMSRNFRDRVSAQPINSDTQGMLTVYATDKTLLANQAVAIIFSAGDTLPGQNRSSANINLISNYLDQSNCPGIDCRDNTVATGPFFLGPVSDSNGNTTLNDKLLVIQAKDFIPTVEKRVAKELSDWLQTYFSANHYYPYPAKASGCNQNNCQGDVNICRGRFPSSAATGNASLSGIPSYFFNNQWYREIYYSAGKASLQSPAGITCQNTLNVSGSAVSTLFFMPGTPISNARFNNPSNSLADYLEDTENQDGWSAGANDTYVIPTSTSMDRDRLYSLP